VKIILCCCLVLSFSSASHAYSVLTHEAIIDSAWEGSLKPLLVKQYPDSTPEELLKARSYAYGGSLMGDMGYYPFGNKTFSDLIHYVRTGEFVETLIRESQNLNEYAFALGALSHYPSDSNGHSLATNHVVPMLFPDLRKKYGDIVTYDEKPSAHIRAEFGFDVLQVARGDYLPESYHDFIGFELSKELLERVFPKVYSLELDDVLTNFGMAKGTFRFAVSDLVPELTKVAWELKGEEIMKLRPGTTREKFLYVMPRKDFEQEWGKEYRRPRLCTRILAFFIRILPKIGPLKVLKVKLPTPETEKLFLESYEVAALNYHAQLDKHRNGKLHLENRNLDTGEPTKFGEYERADKTYAKLLEKLAENNFVDVTPELQEDILNFFQNLKTVYVAAKDNDDWEEILQNLRALESIETSAMSNEEKDVDQQTCRNSSLYRLQTGY
jgi:hypothetical protein